MRERRAQAAVVETARGGILRRGVALSQAQVALVTNVSADHFGEYGIDDLEGLADVKLSVAALLPDDGLLVLNAEDAQLVAKARHSRAALRPLPATGVVRARCRPGAAARAPCPRRCHLRGACRQLLLNHAGREFDLGAITAMPLTVDGQRHLQRRQSRRRGAGGGGARACRRRPSPAVFARFGAQLADNFGRLMQLRARRRAGAGRLRAQPRGAARAAQRSPSTCAAATDGSACCSAMPATARTPRSRRWRRWRRSFTRRWWS